jgi:hypothetical protein
MHLVFRDVRMDVKLPLRFFYGNSMGDKGAMPLQLDGVQTPPVVK